jgi:hypothetical protein
MPGTRRVSPMAALPAKTPQASVQALQPRFALPIYVIRLATRSVPSIV